MRQMGLKVAETPSYYLAHEFTALTSLITDIMIA